MPDDGVVHCGRDRADTEVDKQAGRRKRDGAPMPARFRLPAQLICARPFS
jgi:hypothetical protein